LIPVPAAVAFLTKAAARVCRIVFDRGTTRERSVATGFLVGADLVMTSAHVWPSVLAGTTARERVALLFDDGSASSLAADWLAVFAPRDLDVSVVRLARTPSRGWIDFPPRPPLLVPEMFVTIVQFPRSSAPSLSVGVVRRVDYDARRIVYSVPTVGGSSGAPVFDAAMRLIAVHRGTSEGRTNEGVLVRSAGGG
jgi:hypothetical protein